MCVTTTVTVCRTCRPDGGEPPGAELGRAVQKALAGLEGGSAVEVRAIACLSACSRACTASVAATGKFSYVVGGLEAGDAEALALFAALHAQSPDGVPPWRQRPEKIRKNTVARVPPVAGHALSEPIEDELSLHR